MLSVVIQALKSRLCSSVHLSHLVILYTATELLKSPCIAHQPDGIHPVQIHLIGIWVSLDHKVSVIKRFSSGEFTLWGRDLVSVVRIRASSYYRGFF